ncbi:MAG: LPXTG cell wall anchor domain-containing protein [Acidimicrobiia bacterium]|nr:LPXTG cell wall anchor domain-containing protein [Acidimicrobiia bacterium]
MKRVLLLVVLTMAMVLSTVAVASATDDRTPEPNRATVVWEMWAAPPNHFNTPQNYVGVTYSVDGGLEQASIPSGCERMFQVDVYKYKDQQDRDNVDALIKGGILNGPSDPVHEPLIGGGAGTAWKFVYNEECEPGIDIRKGPLGTAEDEDPEEGPETTAVDAGSKFTFHITVTNTGETTLTDVTVSDPNTPACDRDKNNGDTGGLASMEPGDSVSYECVTDALKEGFTNTATATGTSGDKEVSDEDSSIVTIKESPPTTTPPTTLPPKPTPPDVDVLASGVIGDRVWYDTDKDGVQDAGEAGIPGSTVQITGLDGQDVDPVTPGIQTSMTMLTGDDGKYLFSGLPEGNYKVDTKATWIPNPENLGLGFTTPSSFTIALPDGGENLTADFGVVADQLPVTGLNTDTLLIVAILLMIAGAGAVLVTRRRKDNSEDLAA